MGKAGTKATPEAVGTQNMDDRLTFRRIGVGPGGKLELESVPWQPTDIPLSEGMIPLGKCVFRFRNWHTGELRRVHVAEPWRRLQFAGRIHQRMGFAPAAATYADAIAGMPRPGSCASFRLHGRGRPGTNPGPITDSDGGCRVGPSAGCLAAALVSR